METFGNGFSLSSTTLPETTADLFCEKAITVSKVQIAVRIIWRTVFFISESAFKIRIYLHR